MTISPSKLDFYVITCVGSIANRSCSTYMGKNIMLGQKVIIDACVQDYYDHPVDATRFVVSGDDGHYRVNGSLVLISCIVFQGISVIGERIFHVTIFR